jgi:hypothetical protein
MLVATATVGVRGEPVRRWRRWVVVVSLVLFLGALAVLYGLVPAAAEEAVEAYQSVTVALLTGATVLLIVAAVTARPPR